MDVKNIIVVEGKPEASLELPQKLGVGSIVVEDRPETSTYLTGGTNRKLVQQ